MMIGYFGVSALNLEMQVTALTHLLVGALEILEPGVIVHNVDPMSGWVSCSLPNPTAANGEPRIYGHGDDFKNAIDNARRQVKLIEDMNDGG